MSMENKAEKQKSAGIPRSFVDIPFTELCYHIKRKNFPMPLQKGRG
jgi:hypothetical protein